LEEEMRLPGAGGGGGNGIRFGAAREPPGRPPRDFNRLAGFRRSLALCPRSPASGRAYIGGGYGLRCVGEAGSLGSCPTGSQT
jgi:hypothetical protein